MTDSQCSFCAALSSGGSGVTLGTATLSCEPAADKTGWNEGCGPERCSLAQAFLCQQKD